MVPDDHQADPAAPPAAPQRTFTSFLIDQRKGQLLSELTELLHESVLAVQSLGGTATLQLNLKVKQTKTGAFEVYDDVKSKMPQPEKRPSLFFPAADGSLHRTNPDQPELPLQQVPRPIGATAGGAVTS